MAALQSSSMKIHTSLAHSIASTRSQSVLRHCIRPYICKSTSNATRKYSTSQDDGPLKGVRILDFTRILAGPFCTQILSDYGADVIKVEQPAKGDETRAWKGKDEAPMWQPDTGPMSFFFASLNRNKRSITIDLKKPEGKEVIHRMVERGDVDVVLENFVPGATDRLGIGWKDLSKLNKKLIYASLSGYGSEGPFAHRAGYDAIAAAEAGFMQVTGHPDTPPIRAGLGMLDMSTGLYTHGAIMAALLSRNQTGRGQYLSSSLFETQISMLISVGVNWLNRGIEGQRYGAAHPNSVPYNAWQCADGMWIVIAANSEKQYQILCERMERPELIDDERFKTNALRVENRKAMDKEVADSIASRPLDEWLSVFDGSGLAHGPVNTIQRAFEHPQIEARGMIRDQQWDAQTSGQWKAIGPAVKFSETKADIRRPPPKLGEHTEEVLTSAGYDKTEIESMREKGIL